MLSKRHPNKTKEQIVLSSTRHPKEQKSDVAFILNTVGRLWLAGIQMNWSGLHADESQHRLPLPTYPFERKRHWISGGRPLYAAASTAPSSSEELEKAPLSNRTHSEQKIDNKYANAPRNGVEQSVANIWQELLGIEQVGIHDNFFELGGYSLLATQVISRLRDAFGVKLSLPSFFETPTVAELAVVIERAKDSDTCLPNGQREKDNLRDALRLLESF
jgi:acyl carrier protein